MGKVILKRKVIEPEVVWGNFNKLAKAVNSLLESPSGGFVWGTGTGTITDQTDLISYIDSLPVKSHTHSAADITSGVLSPLRGGTGINTYVAGQLLVAVNTSTLGVINPDAEGKVLTIVSGMPAWKYNTGWGTNGNVGTNPSVNYIGSSDNVDVVFKANNVEFAKGSAVNGGQLRIGGASGFLFDSNSGTPVLYALGTPGLRLSSGVDSNAVIIKTNETRLGATAGGANYPITLFGTSSGLHLAEIGLNKATYQGAYIANNTAFVNHLDAYFDIVAGVYAPTAPNVKNQALRFYTKNTGTGIFGNIILSHNGSAATGNVLVGHSVDSPSAIFNVNSSEKGSLPAPRMTTSIKNSISAPAEALMVYDTTLKRYEYYNGTAFSPMGGGGDPVVDISSTSVVGWASFTTKKIFYQVSGKVLRLFFHLEGTSNNNLTSFTLPSGITAHTDLPEQWQEAKITNNGIAATGYMAATANSGTVNLYRTFSTANWANTGSKSCIGCATILIN